MDDKEANRKRASDYYWKNRERVLLAQKAYHAQHRRQRNARSARWQQRNPVRSSLLKKRWAANNQMRVRQNQRRSYLKNRGRILANQREQVRLHPAKFQARRESYRPRSLAAGKRWRLKNKDRIKLANKRWRLKNPLRRREHESRRRARKYGVRVDVRGLESVIKKLRASKTLRCYYCKCPVAKGTMQIDHVLPLCLGGSHSAENIAVSCTSCNQSKQARPLSIWNETLSQPVLSL